MSVQKALEERKKENAGKKKSSESFDESVKYHLMLLLYVCSIRASTDSQI